MRIDRDTVIKTLRDLNKLSDEEIGAVVGLTRERIAQIAGRKKEDPDLARYRVRCEKVLRRYLPKGFVLAEIQLASGIPLRDLRSALARLGLHLSDFADARWQRKIKIVLGEIRQFLKQHKVPLMTTTLMRLDRTLYSRMWTLMPIKDWRLMLKKEE